MGTLWRSSMGRMKGGKPALIGIEAGTGGELLSQGLFSTHSPELGFK